MEDLECWVSCFMKGLILFAAVVYTIPYLLYLSCYKWFMHTQIQLHCQPLFKSTKLDLPLLVFASLPYLASLYLHTTMSSQGLLPSLSQAVPFTYRSIHLATSHSPSLGFSHKRMSVETAIARPGRVHTARYMRLPTKLLHGTSPISGCTLVWFPTSFSPSVLLGSKGVDTNLSPPYMHTSPAL